MARFAACMASYLSQQYGPLGLNHWPKWFCAFVTPCVTGTLLALIACWAISRYGYSGRLSPRSSHSKPCRVCEGVIEGSFLSSSHSHQAIASTHSATDDVEVERPLRLMRLFQIVEGMTSMIRFGVYTRQWGAGYV
jgi:hypothetical protein